MKHKFAADKAFQQRARAAIYARYSSSLQRPMSIVDQIAICRRYAERAGFDVTAVFQDSAISGEVAVNRPGYRQMLDECRAGRFDVVITESTDRLARNVADVTALHQELIFLQISIHTPASGEKSDISVGLEGLFGQMTLKEIKKKTKRGQEGRLRCGKTPGGLGYGYRVAPTDDDGRGGREIIEVQAFVIRRIFREYANGRSPSAIAAGLNRDGIPGPDGRNWSATTIRGQRKRQTGILNNEAYIGVIVWNRCSYVKDPRSGKRLARPNPPSEWHRVEAPELRIIDDELWQRVKRQQERVTIEMPTDTNGNPLNRVHRRKFMLSGLLTCDCCGGNYTISGRDVYACSVARNKGTCSNRSHMHRGEAEARVLAALKERLIRPEMIETFIRTVHEELRSIKARHQLEHAGLNDRLSQVTKSINGIVSAVEAGAWSESLNTRLQELEEEKRELLKKREKASPVETIDLHPDLAAVYRRKVEQLAASLNDPMVKDEAINAIRSLIERIKVRPHSDGSGVDLYVTGAIVGLFQLCELSAAESPDLLLSLEGKISVVAGAGFEPATFRL